MYKNVVMITCYLVLDIDWIVFHNVPVSIRSVRNITPRCNKAISILRVVILLYRKCHVQEAVKKLNF